MRGLPHILNSPCLPWLLAFRTWINFFRSMMERRLITCGSLLFTKQLPWVHHLIFWASLGSVWSLSPLHKWGKRFRGELNLATFCSRPEFPQDAAWLHTVLCPSQPPVCPPVPCPHCSSPGPSSRSLLLWLGKRAQNPHVDSTDVLKPAWRKGSWWTASFS